MKLQYGSRRGNALVDVLVAAAVIVLVIIPVFSAVVEKYVLQARLQIIKDAVDMTNLSTYTALNTGYLGMKAVSLDEGEAVEIYKRLLAENLNLNSDLSSRESSVAEGVVTIDALEMVIMGLPAACPDGTVLKRPSIHSMVTVPVKPSLFQQLLLEQEGKTEFKLKVHVDSEIPLND